MKTKRNIYSTVVTAVVLGAMSTLLTGCWFWSSGSNQQPSNARVLAAGGERGAADVNPIGLQPIAP